MIQLTGVSKYYKTLHGTNTVLDNISLTIRPGEHVGILGRNGAGKSTLVRIIGGADTPSEGDVRRAMTVSWPLAFTGGFHTALTGADNLRFICRIYDVDFAERIDYVKEFSELGSYLYEPVRTYSSGMRAKLAFGISMSIDFDCYLMDEVMAVGDESFREKCRIELFEKRSHKAMIIVSHSHRYLNGTCDRFLLLRDAKIEEFYDFRECYRQYKLMIDTATDSARAASSV